MLREAEYRAKCTPMVKGTLLIMLGAFCFSLAPIFARSVEGYSTPSIAFYRAFFTLTAFLAGTVAFPKTRTNLNPRARAPKVTVLLISLGLMMGLTSLLFTHAYLHTTVAKAMLLNYTAPLYVAVISPWLLREQRPRYAWAALPLGMIGIGLVVNPMRLLELQASQLVGDISGLASGMTYAAVFILARYLSDKADSATRTTVGAAVMTLMFLPWGLTTLTSNMLWANLPYLCGLGLVSMALAYFLMFKGQELVTAQVGSMIALFEPVCGILIGWIIYGEALTALALGGAVLALLAIYLSTLS